MALELTGEIIALLPMVEGQGKNGPWFKQEYIMEIPGQYPKKVCISLWGDKIKEYNLSVGMKVTAHLDIESREYNGKWFTECKGWKIDKDTSGLTTSTLKTSVQQRPADPVPPQFASGESDDLPF